MTRLIRSWLYVPADRPDLFAKALVSNADALVLDLEDAVAPSHKPAARDHAAAFVAQRHDRPVLVRINPLGAGGDADLDAVALPGLAAVRLPKAESADAVREVAAVLERAGVEAGVVPMIETAIGVERAQALATAHSRVVGLALGEYDLLTAVGGVGTLGWCRSRIVLAAAAAGLPRPPQSVYPSVRDVEGLRDDCAAGRAAGFFGRSAIHPRQVPVINAAYTPSRDEVQAARSLVDATAHAHERGAGAWLDGEGRLVDAAAVARARATLELAAQVSA